MPHSLHFLTHTVFIATLCMYEMVAENNATFLSVLKVYILDSHFINVLLQNAETNLAGILHFY